MAKKKSRKKTGQGQAKPAARPWHGSTGARVAIVVAVAGALFLGWRWSLGSRAESAFLEHAQAGQAALEEVTRLPEEESSGHMGPGESLRYASDPPTSGRHSRVWVDPGVYESVQPKTGLVHSLEHGMVVIYVDEPTPAARQDLVAWAGLYGGKWSGIVIAPKPGLGEAVILTAWRRLIRLDEFDPDAAAAFIDAYRGRGPENRVR